MDKFTCPQCGKSEFIKYGKHANTGKQKYKCKSCKRVLSNVAHTGSGRPKRTLNEKHLLALLLRIQGYSLRSIANLFNTCPSTIKNWNDGICRSLDNDYIIELNKPLIAEFNKPKDILGEKNLLIQIKSHPKVKEIKVDYIARRNANSSVTLFKSAIQKYINENSITSIPIEILLKYFVNNDYLTLDNITKNNQTP